MANQDMNPAQHRRPIDVSTIRRPVSKFRRTHRTIFPCAQSARDKALRLKYIPEYSAAAALALQMLFDSRETGETAWR